MAAPTPAQVERAVTHGDVSTLRAALDATLPRDRPAFLADNLVRAARATQRSVITFLLSAGADINVVNRFRASPLYAAVVSSAPSNFVDFLLAAGADPNGPIGAPRGAPLLAAIDSSRADIVRRLISAGADARGFRGTRNPLEAACTLCGGDLEIIRLLLAAGAAVSAGAALALMDNRYAPVAGLELLVAHGFDPSSDPDRMLAHAALHSLAMLNFLKRRGLRFNPPQAQPALNGLVYTTPSRPEETADIIRTIAALGCNVNQRDAFSNTLLHYAAHSSALCVTALIECGADLNARDSRGDTPLHSAVLGSRGSARPHETIWALILAGADLDATNEEGETPRSLLHRLNRSALVPVPQKLL